MRKRIRLLVVDDHPVVRKGICSWLEHVPELEVIGEAGDGASALRIAKELRPDLVLMDLDLPHMDGLATTRLLCEARPQIKVIILCMHRDDRLSARIIECGACGYILKTDSREGLVLAVEAVVASKPMFIQGQSRRAAAQLVDTASEGPDLAMLTDRERDVLCQVAEGFSNKEIAERLSLSLRTVEAYRESLMRKLNIHTVAGLTKFAVVNGLSPLPENPEGSVKAA